MAFYQETIPIINRICHQVLVQVQREVDQKQLLTFLPLFVLTNYKSIIDQVICQQQLIDYELLDTRVKQRPDSQPKKCPQEQYLSKHVTVDKIMLKFQYNDKLSEISINNSFNTKLSFQQNKKDDMTKTLLQVAKKRINVIQQGVIKLKVEQYQENQYEDRIRRRMNEQLRLLQSNIPKTNNQIPINLLKKQVTFDYDGKHIEIKPIKASRKFTHIQSQEKNQQRSKLPEKDHNIYQITHRKRISNNNNQSMLTHSDQQKSLLFSNNNNRQLTHIPYVYLKQETKLIEDQRINQGPKDLAKISRSEYLNAHDSGHFKHFTEKIKSISTNQISQQSDVDFKKSQITEIRTKRRLISRKKPYIDNKMLKQSYNFETSGILSKDARLNRYYKHDYDEQKKKYMSMEKLLPIKREPKSIIN